LKSVLSLYISFVKSVATPLKANFRVFQLAEEIMLDKVESALQAYKAANATLYKDFKHL